MGSVGQGVWMMGMMGKVKEDFLDTSRETFYLIMSVTIFSRYSELMKSLLAPEFRYLVNITQYTPNEKFSGPPRNVPTKLVQDLFGKLCVKFFFIHS